MCVFDACGSIIKPGCDEEESTAALLRELVSGCLQQIKDIHEKYWEKIKPKIACYLFVFTI